MMRPALAGTLLAGVLSAMPASAQAPPTPPDHYALINARIVVAPGVQRAPGRKLSRP